MPFLEENTHNELASLLVVEQFYLAGILIKNIRVYRFLQLKKKSSKIVTFHKNRLPLHQQYIITFNLLTH